jgi:hypothetical protein
MKKPQIKNFTEFLVENSSHYSDWKYDIAELAAIGRSTSFTKLYIQKESKLNESFSFLLESEELMEAMEMQVVSDLFNSDMALEEGFKDFAKSIFGDKVVNAVSSLPSKVYDVGSKILDKGKDIWDKAVTNLKDFVAKAKEIIGNILQSMKKLLGNLWELIKMGIQKAGKYMFSKHAEKLDQVKDSVFSGMKESELSKADAAPMVEEIKTAGSEYTEMINKYFKKDKFETVETEAQKAIENVKESVIWESFVGLYSISEKEEIEELFTMNESGEEHPEKSKIVAWVQSIVQWILSPIGATVELVAQNLTKMAMSAPSAILKGVKNATKYSHLPALAAIIGGIVADTMGIAKGVSHMAHESENVEELQSGGKGVFNNENLNKVAENAAKVATSAIAGYAISIALHSLPALHVAFEAIMLAGLTIMFFGWLDEQGIGNGAIPEICQEFYHWIH